MKRLSCRVVSLAAGLFVMGAAGLAQAQYYYPPQPYPAAGYRPQLYFGAAGVGTHIIDQQGGPELLGDGGGASLFAGLRLFPRFAVELGLLGSDHNLAMDPYGNVSYLVLSGVTADALFHLAPPRSGFDPYLQAGLGGYAIGRDGVGTEASGGGFQLGGGVDIRIGWWWTVGLRLLYRGIDMSSQPGGGPSDTFIHATTFEANLALHLW